jgi:hypothetical protein
MKRKIAITTGERTVIIAALMAYQETALAARINSLFIDADPTNDGPEVEILREGWDA